MAKRKGQQQQKLGDYLTVTEAARFLGVSASTLRNWDRAGKLSAHRHPVNGYRLYERGDLEQILEEVQEGPEGGFKDGD